MTAETITAQSSGNTISSPFRGRAFQFTLNDTSVYESFKNTILKLKSCDYFISCREIAPTTGHEHIHVYAHFQSSYRLSKKILDFHAHIEICKGSPQDNIAYIRKDGEILDEQGREPHQGFHTVGELKNVQEPDELDWREYNTWLKIRSSPKKVKTSEWGKDVRVYYVQGPSGCGKSNFVANMLETEGVDEFEEIKHVGEFWHGIVDGEGVAVYDDFRDSHMSASEFINFIDYRTHNLNVKGGSFRNRYTKIFITSVQDIDDIYKGVNGEPRLQWLRRITAYRFESDRFVEFNPLEDEPDYPIDAPRSRKRMIHNPPPPLF